MTSKPLLKKAAADRDCKEELSTTNALLAAK
jgi:hypothetical protein